MPKNLPLSHSQQYVDGCCLPACVQMVLAYIGISRSQKALGQVMGTQLPLGTPRSVVGAANQIISLMDPALDSGPTPTPIDDFMLAWDEMDNY